MTKTPDSPPLPLSELHRWVIENPWDVLVWVDPQEPPCVVTLEARNERLFPGGGLTLISKPERLPGVDDAHLEAQSLLALCTTLMALAARLKVMADERLGTEH